MTNTSQSSVPKKKGSDKSRIFSSLAIPVAFFVALFIYMFILGDPSHYKGGDVAHGEPVDYFGTIHKGGPIVPVLMTLLLVVVIFSIERFMVIRKAAGVGNIDSFIKKIQQALKTGDMHTANAICDQQKGSVANVVKSGLRRYSEIEMEHNLSIDQKILAIQKDIEEATTLELPMLEQNLTIIATLVSIGTLTGLLGTVTGMIRAFAALASAGAPNQAELATGISEALINTALGILTSTLAIIAYNFFTSSIDKLTYAIDEAGFSIVQTLAASRKDSLK